METGHPSSSISLLFRFMTMPADVRVGGDWFGFMEEAGRPSGPIEWKEERIAHGLMGCLACI
jgi:hypothetical protein